MVRLFLKCHVCCFCTTWKRQLVGVSACLWDQSNKYYWVCGGLKNSLNRIGFLICTTVVIFNGCPYFFHSHGIHEYAIIVFCHSSVFLFTRPRWSSCIVPEHLLPQCDSVGCYPDLNVLSPNPAGEPKTFIRLLTVVK